MSSDINRAFVQSYNGAKKKKKKPRSTLLSSEHNKDDEFLRDVLNAIQSSGYPGVFRSVTNVVFDSTVSEGGELKTAANSLIAPVNSSDDPRYCREDHRENYSGPRFLLIN